MLWQAYFGYQIPYLEASDADALALGLPSSGTWFLPGHGPMSATQSALMTKLLEIQRKHNKASACDCVVVAAAPLAHHVQQLNRGCKWTFNYLYQRQLVNKDGLKQLGIGILKACPATDFISK